MSIWRAETVPASKMASDACSMAERIVVDLRCFGEFW